MNLRCVNAGNQKVQAELGIEGAHISAGGDSKDCRGGVLSGDLKAIAGESGTKEPDSPNWMGELPRMEKGQAGLSSSAAG